MWAHAVGGGTCLALPASRAALPAWCARVHRADASAVPLQPLLWAQWRQGKWFQPHHVSKAGYGGNGRVLPSSTPTGSVAAQRRTFPIKLGRVSVMCASALASSKLGPAAAGVHLQPAAGGPSDGALLCWTQAAGSQTFKAPAALQGPGSCRRFRSVCRTSCMHAWKSLARGRTPRHAQPAAVLSVCPTVLWPCLAAAARRWAGSAALPA